MSHPSKAKGLAHERDIVRRLQAAGFQARRQPLSGASPDFPSDIEIIRDGKRYLGEVKYRREGAGFKRVMDLLKGADVVFLKQGAKAGEGVKIAVCMEFHAWLTWGAK